MENEKVTPDAKQENTPTEEVKAQSVTPDAKQDQIPYARFKEVVASNKDLKSKLEEFESAAEKQRVAELEKKGEYETLLNEVTKKYEAAKEKADQLDAYIAQDRDSILSNYDTEERDIIEALPLDKLKKYHANNLSKQKVSVDASRAGVGQTTPKSFHEMTEDERRDPATWGAYLKSMTRSN